VALRPRARALSRNVAHSFETEWVRPIPAMVEVRSELRSVLRTRHHSEALSRVTNAKTPNRIVSSREDACSSAAQAILDPMGGRPTTSRVRYVRDQDRRRQRHPSPRFGRALPRALVRGLQRAGVTRIVHLGDLTDPLAVPLFEANRTV